MKKNLLHVFISALSIFTLSAAAGDLYRCGNIFQDTPCKNAVNTQSVKKSSAPVANTNAAADDQTATSVDTDCKQRGEAAKKIMWMREVGKTIDDQLASPPAGASPDLIVNVYNRNGSSFQVKNAIERECMQQKEKDKLAEKLMIEAAKLKAGGNISPGATNDAKTSIKTAQDEKVSSSQPSQAPNNKTEQCGAIKSSLEVVANNRRKGGSAEYMDNLKREQKNLTSEFKSLGC